MIKTLFLFVFIQNKFPCWTQEGAGLSLYIEVNEKTVQIHFRCVTCVCYLCVLRVCYLYVTCVCYLCVPDVEADLLAVDPLDSAVNRLWNRSKHHIS